MSREVCYRPAPPPAPPNTCLHNCLRKTGTNHISGKPLTAQVLSLTVLQISLRRCALGLSHPTQTVWPAGHWLFPSLILGGNRSFLWDLIAVPALLIEQFIVGHTSILQFLPTAEKLQESLLGKCVLQQDLAYLSLLMLLIILPPTHRITNLFLSLKQPFIFHLFLVQWATSWKGVFCAQQGYRGAVTQLWVGLRSVDMFLPNIFSPSWKL